MTGIFGIRAAISFPIRWRSAGSATPRVRSSYSFHSGALALAHSGETNALTKVTITTPPFAFIRASTASGTFRGWSHSARAEEWEKMTGASETRSASSIVSSETWERSTSIPSRFISRTTSSPKRGEAAVAGDVGRGVGPVQGLRVGEGHVAHAEVVVGAQRAERVLDHVAALHPEEGGDPLRLHGPLHLVGGRGQGQAVGIAGDDAPGEVDLLELGAGEAAGELGRHVDRPELPAHPALAQPLEVGRAPRAHPEVVGLDVARRVRVLPDGPGQVVVPVDHGVGQEHAPHPLENVAPRRPRRRGREEKVRRQ